MIVEKGACGIVIGIHRNLGQQMIGEASNHSSTPSCILFARTRTRRVLVEPIHVRIEPDALIVYRLVSNPPQSMAPTVFGPLVPEALPFSIHRKSGVPVASQRNGSRERSATAVIAATMER